MLNGKYCRQLNQAIAERDAAIAERDEAIAERDFILNLVQDLGTALCKSKDVTIKPTKRGVEARVLYPTLLDVFRARACVAQFRALLSFTPRPNDAVLEAVEARLDAGRMHA